MVAINAPHSRADWVLGSGRDAAPDENEPDALPGRENGWADDPAVRGRARALPDRATRVRRR